MRVPEPGEVPVPRATRKKGIASLTFWIMRGVHKLFFIKGSGGYRMMVAYQSRERAVFRYAFAKNERDNIDPDERLSLRDIAQGWLAADEDKIALALADGALQDVDHDQDH